jgi:hypothetical protein
VATTVTAGWFLSVTDVGRSIDLDDSAWRGQTQPPYRSIDRLIRDHIDCRMVTGAIGELAEGSGEGRLFTVPTVVMPKGVCQ